MADFEDRRPYPPANFTGENWLPYNQASREETSLAIAGLFNAHLTRTLTISFSSEPGVFRFIGRSSRETGSRLKGNEHAFSKILAR